MATSRVFLLALLGTCLAAALPAHAIGEYRLSFLDTLTGRDGTAHAVNDRGQVAGTWNNDFTGPNHAIRWDTSVRGYLDIPDAGYSEAHGIDSTGRLVGFAADPDNPGQSVAAVWTDRTPTYLRVAGAYTFADAINTAGQVVGRASFPTDDGSPSTAHAILWNGSTAVDLHPAGRRDSSAFSINEAGQVAGMTTDGLVPIDPYPWEPIPTTYATVWNGRTATDLPGLGGPTSIAYDINDQGQVAGYSTNAERTFGHAVLWNDGDLTDLGTLGGFFSIATALNDSGLVVGSADLADNMPHAALWQDGTVTDLNIFMDADSRRAGWILRVAEDVSDTGLIVGSAFNEFSGEDRAFFLSPVPEPETGALLLAGLALVGWASRGPRRFRQRGASLHLT